MSMHVMDPRMNGHPTVNKSLKIDDCGGQGSQQGSQPNFFNSGAGGNWGDDFGYSNTYNPPNQIGEEPQSSNNDCVGGSVSRLRAESPTASMSSSTGDASNASARSRVGKVYKNKDEKVARDAGINFTIDQIVGLPMDEFNDLLSRHELTEEQLNMCRDIRRRGKNKVAAQNCRRRKLDHVDELESKIDIAKDKYSKLEMLEKKKLDEKQHCVEELNKMVNDVLNRSNFDPKHYSLVNIEGIIRIEPKVNGKEPYGSLRPEVLLAEEENSTSAYHPFVNSYPQNVHHFY